MDCMGDGSGCTASGFGQGNYGALAHSHFPGFPGGRLAGVRPINVHTSRSKYPRIQNNYMDGRESSVLVEGEVSPLSFSSQNSDNNSNSEKDICGRHFLFNKKWRNDNRMCTKCDFRDMRPLQASSSIPPLPRDYQTHRSNHLHHHTHHKELSPAPTRPHAFGPRTINQPCSLFTTESHQRCTQSYPDPVSGASSAAFNRRLSEISSLEGDTVRHEKMKNMKKTKRQDS